MSKHPALHMSKVREKVWLEEASDEDYFDMIELLAALYAKKIHKQNERAGKYISYDPDVLFTDYEKHQKAKLEAAKNEASNW